MGESTGGHSATGAAGGSTSGKAGESGTSGSGGAISTSRNFTLTGSDEILNGKITEQGVLLDSTGVPFGGVQFRFVFALYSVATDGTILWSQTQQFIANPGSFPATLGDSLPIPAAVLASGTLHLGITIGTDAEMVPRQVPSKAQ